MSSENLQKWIVMQMADPTEAGGVSLVSLLHTIDEQHDLIESFEVDSEMDASDLASRIWDAAEVDSRSRAQGGRQRYSVVIFRGEDRAQPTATRAFLLFGTSSGENERDFGQSSDPPNERGLLSQLMRHNDQQARMMQVLSDSMFSKLIAQNSQLTSQVDAMTGKQLDMFTLHQRMLDTQAQREMEQAKEANRERRHEQLIGVFTSMVPLLFLQFMGNKALPQGIPTETSMRDTVVGRFLDSLTPEELSAASGKLNSMRQIVFVEIYKSYKSGKLDGYPATMRDKAVQDFLESLEPEEAMGFMSVLSQRSLDIFRPLYNSYAKSASTENEKQPIPFRKKPS